jgi:hypothetical protein
MHRWGEYQAGDDRCGGSDGGDDLARHTLDLS